MVSHVWSKKKWSATHSKVPFSKILWSILSLNLLANSLFRCYKSVFSRVCSGTTRAKADPWLDEPHKTSTLRLTFVTTSTQSLPCFFFNTLGLFICKMSQCLNVELVVVPYGWGIMRCDEKDHTWVIIWCVLSSLLSFSVKQLHHPILFFTP